MEYIPKLCNKTLLNKWEWTAYSNGEKHVIGQVDTEAKTPPTYMCILTKRFQALLRNRKATLISLTYMLLSSSRGQRDWPELRQNLLPKPELRQNLVVTLIYATRDILFTGTYEWWTLSQCVGRIKKVRGRLWLATNHELCLQGASGTQKHSTK